MAHSSTLTRLALFTLLAALTVGCGDKETEDALLALGEAQDEETLSAAEQTTVNRTFIGDVAPRTKEENTNVTPVVQSKPPALEPRAIPDPTRQFIGNVAPRSPQYAKPAAAKAKRDLRGLVGGSVQQDRSFDSLEEAGAMSESPITRWHQVKARKKTMQAPTLSSRAAYDSPLAVSHFVPPAPRYNTESYTDYGVNGFAMTAHDPLSTFSIDVDTASYTLTRSKLNSGYLPPSSAVRVEEFVNFLPYNYPEPDRASPFSVAFEAAPSPFHPLNTIVRVGVQGKHLDPGERKPVHLTFLIDTSGSMQSRNKMGLVKQSLQMLTQELEDGDTVAIATYAGFTSIALNPTPMSRKAEIFAALDRLSAGGSTAMGAGIDLAYQLAEATQVQGAVNRVIICSDGDANVGNTNQAAMSQKIKRYAKQGISLTTVGFGNGNYKDTMMEQLANNGDGNYYYIDSLQEARRVFVEKLDGTLEVIAKDVKIQVEWDPSQVVAYRLIGYENRDIADRDFRNDAVDAGEIGAGHQVTALYEVALNGRPHGDIAIVRVRNKAPGPDARAVERAYSLSVDALQDDFYQSSKQFRMAFAAASFAEVLRQSPHVAGVSLSQIEGIAHDASRRRYREDAELVELIHRADQLSANTALSFQTVLPD